MKVYTVDDAGELQTASVGSYNDLQKDEVYLIVVDNIRKIFIWKGESAPVRRKFISARTASKMRMELGMTYKIDSLDPGLEGNEFLGVLSQAGISTSGAAAPKAKTVSAPRITARPGEGRTPEPAYQPQPKPAPRAQPKPAPRAQSQPAPRAQPKPAPRAQPKPAPRAQPKPAPRAQSQPAPRAQSQPAPRAQITQKTTVDTVEPTAISSNIVLERLEKIGEPTGMIREIVIVGDRVYSIYKDYSRLFNKETLRLEEMTDLPDGTFPAAEYYTRLYVENGRVIFIELFREAPKDERDEFVTEMKGALRDLTKLGI